MAAKRGKAPPNGEKTRFRSGAQAAEAGRKGGLSSAASRREAAQLSKIAKKIAATPIGNKKNAAALRKLGIETDDATNNAMVAAGVYIAAAGGDMSAVNKWEKWTDDETAHAENPFELPARCISRGFVDFNRQIIPDRTYIARGGRGSGKSSYVSQKIIELIKQNPDLHACVCRKVGGTMRDSVFAQIKWAIGELGLESEFSAKVSPMEIELTSTGQRIYFRGLDDPIKLKSIKPPFGAIGILWVEEADQIDGEEQLRSVRQSVLRGGAATYEFLTYNPPAAARNWMNRFVLVPNPNVVVHTSTYLDVPPEWLGKRFFDDAEFLRQTNETAYRHEYLGEIVGSGTAVFENLDLSEISQETKKTFGFALYGVDWGWYPDPWAYNAVYYDHARRTLYIYDELTRLRTPNRDTADLLIQRGVAETGTLTADSAEPKSCADYRAYGLPCRAAEKGPGSVTAGMKWLQGLDRIVIDPAACPDTAREFAEYEYERDPRTGDVLQGYPDVDNHHIDAVRYATEQIWRQRGT